MCDRSGFVFTNHASRITNHESRITNPPTTMFFRFIIYCLLAYIVLRFVRRLLSPVRPPRVASRNGGAAQLIRCQNCGMFVTQTSALLVGGREFCSRSCAQKTNKV